MNESDFNDLKSRGRKLTAAEEADLRAWLAEHPDRQADWESERRLSEILRRLPDVPVPSNFTARVLQAVEREEMATRKPQPSRARWFFRFLPRIAVAAVIFGVAAISYQEHEAAKRAQLVQGVKVVAGVPSLPSPEILQDFDTIRQMSSTPGADPELIALMK